MKKTELMYEGKAKRVYATDTDGICIVDYKDDATAFNGAKKGTIVGKGVVNNRMSNRIMRMLEKHDIPTHLIEELSERETAVVRVSIVPVEVIVRNIAAGSLSKRLGIEEGTKLPSVVLEYCYKNDALDDPMINDSHAIAMGLATKEDLDTISAYALKIDEILIDFFAKLGIELVDFKIEFGKKPDGTIILADEISPDTCRLWDSITHEKLDKDRFRRDMGGVEDAYQEVMRRLTGE
ncbi:MAG: phosphoribosylaminoimidazolesuccinocarboxamide synthase [Eubacteriales bacterium]|nr:phosphoribosylaminoimidazolesuccinocarboxamide synthase [Eubacteriales bacterium]MDD7550604.1 phosphoribosylaminoimidazolesuccinocarboxamide synthase [Clostridia bacterium]MDY5754180.1 phosphoribosylaminoimidazolesuccinocarboxamide synthase [Eubacteriales bacterium]